MVIQSEKMGGKELEDNKIEEANFWLAESWLENIQQASTDVVSIRNQQRRDERRRLWRSNRGGAQQATLAQNSGRKTPGKARAVFFERIQKTLRIARKSGVLCETGQKKIPESVSLFLVSRNVFGFVADLGLYPEIKREYYLVSWRWIELSYW